MSTSRVFRSCLLLPPHVQACYNITALILLAIMQSCAIESTIGVCLGAPSCLFTGHSQTSTRCVYGAFIVSLFKENLYGYGCRRYPKCHQVGWPIKFCLCINQSTVAVDGGFKSTQRSKDFKIVRGIGASTRFTVTPFAQVDALYRHILSENVQGVDFTSRALAWMLIFFVESEVMCGVM